MIQVNLIRRETPFRPSRRWHWVAAGLPTPNGKRRGSYFWGTRHARPGLGLSPRDAYLARTYGMCEADVRGMIEAQGHRCAACRCAFEGRGKDSTAAVIDHCHATGRVRGILCNRCNRAFGILGDDPATVAALARYAADTAGES